VETLDLLSQEEGLEKTLNEGMTLRPTILEPPSPAGLEEIEEQGRTQLYTMVATTQQGEATSLNTTPALNPEEMREIVAA